MSPKKAKLRAQEILDGGPDPLEHLRDFESLWIAEGYCQTLRDFGTLDDELHVSKYMDRAEQDVRGLILATLKKLVET